jgi:hypothetical protein
MDLAEELASTAQWRRDKAAQYRDDTRNTEAAERLERLAVEVDKLGESFLFRRLERINDELLSVRPLEIYYLVTAVDEYQRSIGFHAFPDSGEDYLKDLIKIYSKQLVNAESYAAACEERQAAFT